MLVRMQRNGNPLTLLVGMQTGTATLENMEVPQKVKNSPMTQQLLYWLFIPKIQM